MNDSLKPHLIMACEQVLLNKRAISSQLNVLEQGITRKCVNPCIKYWWKEPSLSRAKTKQNVLEKWKQDFWSVNQSHTHYHMKHICGLFDKIIKGENRNKCINWGRFVISVLKHVLSSLYYGDLHVVFMVSWGRSNCSISARRREIRLQKRLQNLQFIWTKYSKHKTKWKSIQNKTNKVAYDCS